MKKKKRYELATKLVVAFFLTNLFFLLLGSVAQAAGLVEDTVNSGHGYSKFAFDHYQLDFYVDNSWDWLPWNWLDGIGKSVLYGVYVLTDFIWTLSRYISYATGYLVQEAYKLDLIGDMADLIGKNIQKLAGVTKQGIRSDGFYVGFLLIFMLIVGAYVAYKGLIKREMTKAIGAVLNFVVVFVISAGLIAYAPDYIKKINDFSKDISNATLNAGANMIHPDGSSTGMDGVELIRENLFQIQVRQPWLLLQYGSTSIQEERSEQLLELSPDLWNGEFRQEQTRYEVEKMKNSYLTVGKVGSRFGMVFFLFFLNLGISAFVLALTALMLISQVMFLVFAMFVPVSFLISMIPGFERTRTRAIEKLFNTIMSRAGIILVLSVAFSISSVCYTLAGDRPFFLVAFLQIVTFGGIFFQLNEIMGLISLKSRDSQGIGRQLFRRPRMFMRRHTRRLQRQLGKTISLQGGNRNKRNPGDPEGPHASASGSGNRNTDGARRNKHSGRKQGADFNQAKAPKDRRSGQKKKRKKQKERVQKENESKKTSTRRAGGTSEFVRDPSNRTTQKKQDGKRVRSAGKRRSEKRQKDQRQRDPKQRDQRQRDQRQRDQRQQTETFAKKRKETHEQRVRKKKESQLEPQRSLQAYERERERKQAERSMKKEAAAGVYEQGTRTRKEDLHGEKRKDANVRSAFKRKTKRGKTE